MLLWRNIALVLAVAVITLGVVAAQQARSARQTENELAARYQHAFFESLGHTENVEVLLAKGVAASGPTQIAELFTALSASAYAAQSSLTSLPLMHGSTIETGKFLTQVADFGAMIARKAAAGIPPSEEEMAVLRSMRREVALLNDSLHRIYQDVAQGQMPWSEIQRRADAQFQSDDNRPIQGGFTPLESHFQQIPVIEYDGPFSDHLLAPRKALMAGDEIDENEALSIARAFTGGERAVVERQVDGPIPAFTVSVDGDDNRTFRTVMDISIHGGHVIWMMKPRRTPMSRLSNDEAIQRAEIFLTERGYGPFEAGRMLRTGHEAVIPFIPVQDEVLLYPDQIKITVALDDGEIIGFEASQYVANHTERQWEAPRLTEEEATQRIAAPLTTTDAVRLAIIPTPLREEVLAWEVPATGDGEQYLIYINAHTGAEEAVFRIVTMDEGKMAI